MEEQTKTIEDVIDEQAAKGFDRTNTIIALCQAGIITPLGAEVLLGLTNRQPGTVAEDASVPFAKWFLGDLKGMDVPAALQDDLREVLGGTLNRSNER